MSRIPKIIHQTWKYETVPEKWVSSQKAWKALHPTWEYKLWTDDDLHELVATKYPWFLPTYEGYQYVIQRVDAGRCFVLHSEGGWYCDLDIEPTKAFDDLLEGDPEVLLVASSSQKRLFTNALMASVKGAPFWGKIFRELLARAEIWKNGADILKGLTVMKSTGPLMLTEVARRNRHLFKKLTNKVMTCSMCEHKPCHHAHTYTRILKGDSWHNFACTAATFTFCSWKHFLIIGVVVLLFWFLFRRGYRIALNPL